MTLAVKLRPHGLERGIQPPEFCCLGLDPSRSPTNVVTCSDTLTDMEGSGAVECVYSPIAADERVITSRRAILRRGRDSGLMTQGKSW
jgi:hypothetical protein